MKKIFKRLFLLVCLLLMLMSLVACNIKQKIGEKIGEKIVESALGNKVDIDGNEVKIKGDDGQIVTYGSDKWPESDLIKKIPKFEKGTIEGSYSDNKGAIISLKDVKKDDFLKYLEKVKDKFPVNASEYNAEDLITYSGSNDKNITVHISLLIKEMTMGIQIMDESE